MKMGKGGGKGRTLKTGGRNAGVIAKAPKTRRPAGESITKGGAHSKPGREMIDYSSGRKARPGGEKMPGGS